jgi:hypothetical protein
MRYANEPEDNPQATSRALEKRQPVPWLAAEIAPEATNVALCVDHFRRVNMNFPPDTSELA